MAENPSCNMSLLLFYLGHTNINTIHSLGKILSIPIIHYNSWQENAQLNHFWLTTNCGFGRCATKNLQLATQMNNLCIFSPWLTTHKLQQMVGYDKFSPNKNGNHQHLTINKKTIYIKLSVLSKCECLNPMSLCGVVGNV